MLCEPTTAEENVYVADPLTKVSAGLCAVPSTVIVAVPVGVAVLELDPEATVMPMASPAPGAGVKVAATSVVLEVASVGDTGQADSRLKKSIEPSPDAAS
jgi:hypothetical protein